MGGAQCNRRLRRHGFEQCEIRLGETALVLVQRLDDADDLARHRPHGRTQDAFGGKSGLLVDGRIEELAGIGIVDDFAGAGLKDVAGDAGIVEHTDLANEVALRDARI